MKHLVILLPFVTGCMTYAECWWHREADVVQVTWENEFGEALTPNQSSCLHAITIRYANRVCLDDNAIGCTRQRSNGPAIISIKTGLDPIEEIETIRHELTHRLLLCVTGKPYGNHQHEAFAFSSEVGEPTSLASYSFEYEDETYNTFCGE